MDLMQAISDYGLAIVGCVGAECENCSCSEPCTAETCDCVNATEK